MDELNIAINTYRVLVLEEDPYDIIDEDIVAFYIDVFEIDNADFKHKETVADICISIFEKHEHYEKCADLVEYKEKLKYGV
jgi:hypothetical protein